MRGYGRFCSGVWLVIFLYSPTNDRDLYALDMNRGLYLTFWFLVCIINVTINIINRYAPFLNHIKKSRMCGTRQAQPGTEWIFRFYCFIGLGRWASSFCTHREMASVTAFATSPCFPPNLSTIFFLNLFSKWSGIVTYNFPIISINTPIYITFVVWCLDAKVYNTYYQIY